MSALLISNGDRPTLGVSPEGNESPSFRKVSTNGLTGTSTRPVGRQPEPTLAQVPSQRPLLNAGGESFSTSAFSLKLTRGR